MIFKKIFTNISSVLITIKESKKHKYNKQKNISINKIPKKGTTTIELIIEKNGILLNMIHCNITTDINADTVTDIVDLIFLGILLGIFSSISCENNKIPNVAKNEN